MKLNPNLLETIEKTAEIQGEIDIHLKKEAKKYLKAELDELRELDQPILFEVFGMLYEKAKGDKKNLSQKNLEDIQKLIEKPEGTKSINLPGGIKAVRAYHKLDFNQKKEDNILSKKTETKLRLGKNSFENWVFQAEICDLLIKSEDKETLTVDSLLFEDGLSVRHWQEGDRIEKEGIKGRKSLQDLFTDAKIERDKRKKWPVVVNNRNEIIWIPGLSYSRQIEPKTTELIKVTAKKGNE
jgi:tRNA(Ile)-lysidine synthase